MKALPTFRLLVPLVIASLLTSLFHSSTRASTDYGPARWYPVCCEHWYYSGYGKRFYVIHDIEGYYQTMIQNMHTGANPISVHYAVNGKDDGSNDPYPAGDVAQLVRDAYYAWHARCWNQYSMGTEHEGFASNPAWFTEAMYTASASLTASKCNKYNIPKDRNHIIAHGQKSFPGWVNWMTSHGYSYSFATCNDHTDPGPYWNWSHYMDLVQGKPSTPSRPTSLVATAISYQRIDLKWTDNSSVENGFEIQRSGTSSDGPWTSIHNNAENDKTYSVTGLTENKKYWFRVRAYNGQGNSEWSNVDSATTLDRYPPSAPTGLTAVANNDDKITLSWTDNSANEENFNIQQSSDGITFTLVDQTGQNVTSRAITGLKGNRTYYFRVKAINSAGSSAWSNVASDTTPPTAPSGLVATRGAGWDSIDLVWTDNSGAEVGFKIERGTSSSGPWTQIATNAASQTTYTDSGLAGTTTYYYRVRSYNANGNSMYSNVDSATTGNSPPVLATIGNKTVTAGMTLTFTASATDPNQTVNTDAVTGYQSYAVPSNDGNVMFRAPRFSNTTTSFIDTSVTNYTKVVSSQPTGNGSTKALKAHWTFQTGTSNPWLRLSTANAQVPNPVIHLSQSLRFKVHSSKAIKIAIGVRETTNNPAIGGDGGTIGDVEWVGVTNVIGSTPVPTRSVPANTWTTLTFNIQKNPAWSFNGDGVVKTGKGVLEHLAIVADGGTGAYTVYVDDFDVIHNNTLDYSMDPGAPAGASIGVKNGNFIWTPTTGQVGKHTFIVRVTDQLGEQDWEKITVTVVGTGNTAPVLSAIGNKTIKEVNALSFTATATDPDAGQTLSYSLDAGAPSGASINGTSGAFSWTPTEAQGPGTYPITVRVTDNGSPVSNDFETISVTVQEVNTAPVLATISNKTVNETATLNVTASATDSDLPANTLTYALTLAPPGMTINTNTGAMAWTPTETDGPDLYQVIVRATDSGSPKLSAERTFNVTVNELNTAPTLTVSNAISTATTLTDFENYADGSYNGTVMFRQPTYSSSTTSFIDTAVNDETSVTTNSPGGIKSSVLAASWSFKTGTTNPWLRLTTATPTSAMYALPNPTIDLGKHVKFDIYADKSIKVCLGVRETGTSVPLGANGGLTGAIEWIGASGKNGNTPIPTRTVAANTWTTLDFDLPNDSAVAFTGDGVLAPGKGVLEHIAIIPNGTMGVYNVHVDNFKVYSSSTNLTVNTGDEVTLSCFATDSDLPAQALTFSLDAGAPVGAEINDESGVFTWIPTPAQSPSTNVITIRVTDNGSPALSDTKNVTIRVNKVNTPPYLELPGDFAIEKNSSQTVAFTAAAGDDDLPANTLTFSLTGTVPPGASINSTTGDFNWAPPTGTLSTNIITVRVTDNGVPPLYAEQQFTVTVVPVNTAPTLTLGAAQISEPVVDYESFTNSTVNGNVMFRKPVFASTTSSFINTSVSDYTKVTNSFPAGNTNSGSKALVAFWNFKTGTTNYWVRLTTTNTVSVPNPTIDLGARIKFDIHSSKQLKVGLGVRESGTTAQIGADGGTTGGIEWIGVTNKVSGNPIPNRLVPANTWTTLEFDLPNEACTNFSGGNSVLASGKGVLEHLILKGEGGTGAYTVYLDNFQVVTTAVMPSTVTVKAGSTLRFTASATDPNPGTGLSFGLDADFQDSHTNAVIDPTTGAFTWTPLVSDVGTTNSITVSVSDDPTDGGISKSDLETFAVIVSSDPLGPQIESGTAFVDAGETVTLEWAAVAGSSYTVQYKEQLDSAWQDFAQIVAQSACESIVVNNSDAARFYRVVEADGGSAAE